MLEVCVGLIDHLMNQQVICSDLARQQPPVHAGVHAGDRLDNAIDYFIWHLKTFCVNSSILGGICVYLCNG